MLNRSQNVLLPAAMIIGAALHAGQLHLTNACFTHLSEPTGRSQACSYGKTSGNYTPNSLQRWRGALTVVRFVLITFDFKSSSHSATGRSDFTAKTRTITQPLLTLYLVLSAGGQGFGLLCYSRTNRPRLNRSKKK
jgi:hypothetical protein